MAQQGQDAMYHYNYLFMATVLLLPFLLIAMFRPPPNHSGKNLPPGPWRLPVIGSMHHLVGALPHHAMRDLARRYDAPLMLLRLGDLDVVVASSAGAAREILKTHDAVFATRPRTATLRAITRDDLGIALAPNGENWREANATALVSSIVSSLSSSSEPVNVSSLLSTHVTNLAVHAVVGNWNRDLRDEFLEVLDEGVKLAGGFSLADLFPSSRLARAFGGSTRRLEAISHEISRVMDRIIEDHRTRRSAGASDEEEDLVDVLLRVQNDGSLHVPLDDGNIRAVITDMFSGGSETSATTLQWAMAELMRSPVALRRVQAEVRGALMGESCVREDALQELHYLHLVIKETLRLHPVACHSSFPGSARNPVVSSAMTCPREPWCSSMYGRSCGIPLAGAPMLRSSGRRGSRRPVTRQWTSGERTSSSCHSAPAGGCALGSRLGLRFVELMLACMLFHFDWELHEGGAGGLDMAEELGITARRKGDLWLHATVRMPAPNP